MGNRAAPAPRGGHGALLPKSRAASHGATSVQASQCRSTPGLGPPPSPAQGLTLSAKNRTCLPARPPACRSSTGMPTTAPLGSALSAAEARPGANILGS
eukprot:11435736-Heterocapsa_arctica.AAC.1